MTIQVILLSIGLLAISIALISINLIIKKDGKFPNSHVSGNKKLREKGVYCIQTQDKIEQQRVRLPNLSTKEIENDSKTGC